MMSLSDLRIFLGSNFTRMLANFLKKTPKEAVKTGIYLALAGYAGVSVFPVLREWEVFSMFPSKAYMEREVCK